MPKPEASQDFRPESALDDQVLPILDRNAQRQFREQRAIETTAVRIGDLDRGLPSSGVEPSAALPSASSRFEQQSKSFGLVESAPDAVADKVTNPCAMPARPSWRSRSISSAANPARRRWFERLGLPVQAVLKIDWMLP